jgi:hypothetical protein
MTALRRIAAGLAFAPLLFSPVPVACAASAVSANDVEDALDTPLPPEPPPLPPDKGLGGGGFYPTSSQGGGINVDVSVTREITPDFVSINGWCDVGNRGSRAETKQALQTLFEQIRLLVGTDGKVRKNGSFSISPLFETPQPASTPTSFQGSLNVFVRFTNIRAGKRVSEGMEDLGCSVGWDVRLLDSQDHELDVLEVLVKKLNIRKTLFEKLVGRKLERITSASLVTFVDGYSTYDPESNTAEATTTLSVTFDLGTRAVLPKR